MERRGLFTLLLLVSIALALSSCMTPDEPGRYYSRDFGFSIIFPTGWEIQTMKNGWVTLAVTEFEGPTDPFAEAVTIDVYEQPQGFDLDNIFSEQVDGMMTGFENFHEEDRGEITIDGERARWILYTYYFGETGDLMVIEYYLVKDKRAFIIACDSPVSTFADFEDVFTRTVRSFKFE